MCLILKVVCHEIFDLQFFHDSNPSGPLINRLKYFQIRFRFRRDIQILKKLRIVHPTVESDSAVCVYTVESDSTVCITLRSQAPRCASHPRVKWWTVLKKLRGVHLTAESSFAECIISQSASYREVWIHGVHHTEESDSTVCITPQSQ